MERQEPVSEGQEIKVKIVGKGEKGDGIAKINNYVIFIQGVEVDKEYDVKIIRALNNYGFGEVIDSENVDRENEDENVDSENFGDE